MGGPVIALFGANGQVGWELRVALAPLGSVTALTRADADLADADAIRSVLERLETDLIVNAAAFTQVDKAESEPALAMAVNGGAPAVMASWAADRKALFVHFSTDSVFDGAASQPYTEAAACAPVNAYGRSKAAGDQAVAAAGGAHLIFRTAWVYSNRGHNFLRTIRKLARERSELRVVADQLSTPTWARLIAETSAQILARTWQAGEPANAWSGVYNIVAGGGAVSWCDFARAIVGIEATRHPERCWPNVMEITTDQYPLVAPRPRYAVLDPSSLESRFGITVPDWHDQLVQCMEDAP